LRKIAKALAKEVMKRKVAIISGWHRSYRRGSGKKGKRFTPLITSYIIARQVYGDPLQPGIDIIIPKDLGKEVKGFLGDRFSETDYYVDREYLEKRGALKEWREYRIKTLPEYSKGRQSNEESKQ
jgi:hydrogenase maturation factor